MLMQHMRTRWQTLPVRSLAALLDGRCPLVIAPHPDDESLGCGGLLAQCAAAGLPAQVAILTDGSRSHPGSRSVPPRRLAEMRRQEAAAALRALGLPPDALHWFGVEDTRLPGAGSDAESLTRELAVLARKMGCTLIFTPWRYDPHCDHEAAAMIAETLGRRLGCPVLSYPVWGWTLPGETDIAVAVDGFRLDISAQSALKQRAIRAHVTQYGGIIEDAPDGFELPEQLLTVFARPYETFLLP